jgi:hypothetical protein
MLRMGCETASERIQDLFFEGRRGEAIAAVPSQFADEILLGGPKERIKERLPAWKKTPVTTLPVSAQTPETLRTIAELVR